MNIGVSAQRIADDNKEKITDSDNQSHGEANRRLATMRRDTKRHSNDRKGNAGERKGEALVYFGLAGAAFPSVFTLELVEQLLDRQGGTARPFFFLLVQLVQAYRQRSFHRI